jgi:HAD superfamily hydrolase (TIGR01458 family)
MAPRRPPDILRKSHAHTEGKVRSRSKRELKKAADESIARSRPERALLIDLDGVVYRGDEPIEGAAAAIRWLNDCRIPHLSVTNTTSRPRKALVEKLAGFGIGVTADEILSPADAAAAWLAEHGCRKLLLLVPQATAAAFDNFEIAAERVDAVVVGDLGREWTFDRLNAAFRCLMQRPVPKLIALGMTRYWRAPDGLRLDTAPFVMALSHASGVEPIVLGKPARDFFQAALTRLGTAASSTWMIGDDIRADIGGAQEAGLSGLLVRTGKFRPDDLRQDIKPDLVIDSIAELPGVWPVDA